jgi:protein-S-isoprenylcysteine O-methyltransferase Ste14
MAVLALVVLVGWWGVAFGLRSYLHYRRTGSVPILSRDRHRSPQRWTRLLSGAGMLLAVAAPLAELAGLAGLAAIPALDHAVVRSAGLAVAVAGIAGTLRAQGAMGDSWRPDVDPDARHPLVTDGPFRLVRNPVMTCTAATVIGLAMMVPNVVSTLMLVTLIAAIQVQVRFVEEPYLERVHGDAYRSYAARTGRFLPLVGRRSGAGVPIHDDR